MMHKHVLPHVRGHFCSPSQAAVQEWPGARPTTADTTENLVFATDRFYIRMLQEGSPGSHISPNGEKFSLNFLTAIIMKNA